MIQPVHLAMANEAAAEEAEPEPPSLSDVQFEELPEEVPEEVEDPEPEEVVEVALTTEEFEESEEQVALSNDEEIVTVTTESTSDTDTSSSSPSLVTPSENNDADISSDTEDDVINVNDSSSPPEDGNEQEVSTPVIKPVPTSSTTEDVSSTSIESVPEVITKAENLVTDDNYFQFSKQACVSVGGGTYHCSISEGKVVDSNAVVYSETGSSGSPEIFIKTSSGEVKQITDNNFEDSSPHYDPVSQKIAWQRLVQGRYQIIIYDIPTAEEKQLTFSRTNNMEPAVSVAGVVWQAWDNNDWEIMFYDGTYTDQLTNNQAQDVAPVLQDEYIIWTVIGDGSQFAQVYSLDTKETVTINNHEGGSIINPRFVLVYDTQFDNGDVVTQRFDPETGFAEPIAVQPAEAPFEIPEPDTTGEIKALITTKSTSKQTMVVTGDNPDGTDSGTSTTTASGTLNLVKATPDQQDNIISTSTDGTIDVDAGINQPFELTEYDLILPPTKTATATKEVSIVNASSTQE